MTGRARRAAPTRMRGLALATALALSPAAGGAAEEVPRAGEQDGLEGAAARAWELLEEGGDWGKITLDARLRLELAEVDPADEAWATTLRTRLGYRSPEWEGLSFFVEGENVLALDDGSYDDGVGSPNGESVIADPETTELNQGYVQYANERWGTTIRGGRQRIVLDDARFIGNVGWRQNEQTYDAVSAGTSFGVEGLSLFYGYVWDVNRIFGDPGTGPPAARDFDSESHLLNARWRIAPWLEGTAFAYWLDLENEAGSGLSSDSYGLRLQGSRGLGDAFELAYTLSYAYQVDGPENPVDYGAHYAMLDGSLGYEGLGSVGVGYEHLGSDDGDARFVTPLATLHAFNGWADAFLGNGGPDGLRDLYAYAAPELPLGLQSRIVYHAFWSDEGGDELADELDLLLKKPVNEHLTLLAKAAWVEGTSRGPSDRWRLWLQTSFAF